MPERPTLLSEEVYLSLSLCVSMFVCVLRNRQLKQVRKCTLKKAKEMEEAKRRLKGVARCDCEEPTFASRYVCLSMWPSVYVAALFVVTLFITTHAHDLLASLALHV